MKKQLITALLLLVTALPVFAGDIDMERMNTFAKKVIAGKKLSIGYPVNQNVELQEFYRWYAESGLADVSMNNVGNPRKPSLYTLNTHQFENEVIDFFAPLYGFAKDDAWGIVTYSGTDGNNHGIYFGVKYLQSFSKIKPLLYVSEQAHYSIKKLGDLQNLEMRFIPTNKMGQLDVAAFEKVLDPKRQFGGRRGVTAEDNCRISAAKRQGRFMGTGQAIRVGLLSFAGGIGRSVRSRRRLRAERE